MLFGASKVLNILCLLSWMIFWTISVADNCQKEVLVKKNQKV